ncbi:MAG TPA: ABC transporter ATP-binding protein [Longimicrobiaceae bacterium]|nr:ABC transporter ATP-binding protein [Longimicrobiaceae bacterium]
MSNVAIRVEGLGKRYRIGAAAERHDDLRSALTAAVKSPFRNLSRLRGLARFDEAAEEENTVWALKDVSFEVKHGEVLGIIGRNGAGKSTLLKILSRITEPTTGRVQVHGRVGALLEVGTGFHPELTGRENVYLNGSILGMDKRYIDRKFDEIVEFSGVEKFIDTPVKRYSSGMYLRLAFSVAAHLEPEILVVDEVLAVGDAEFQKKCLGKMGEVAGEGRTVLFVSHNMGAVQQLCARVLLISQGAISRDGETAHVLRDYLDTTHGTEADDLSSIRRDRGLGDELRIVGCEILNSEHRPTRRLHFGEPFRVRVNLRTKNDFDGLSVLVGFEAAQGHRIATAASADRRALFSVRRDQTASALADFDDLFLTPGAYSLTLSVRQGLNGLDQLIRVHGFEISPTAFGDTPPHSQSWGDVLTLPAWSSVGVSEL